MTHQVETIWQQLSKDLHRFILGKVNDKMLADDLLHETFIRLHAHIGSLRDETRLRSWMYQVTRNVITDHYRKVKPVTEIIPESGAEEDPKDDSVMAEAVQDMIKFMNQMPAEYCEALCLTELEGLSQKEYADRIGISYSGAKSRVQRARIMLRDMLMKCCHYESDRYGTVLEIHPAGCCCCEDLNG
jgi:RNA polymerase sigma-70 factor, ECF subfamily